MVLAASALLVHKAVDPLGCRVPLGQLVRRAVLGLWVPLVLKVSLVQRVSRGSLVLLARQVLKVWLEQLVCRVRRAMWGLLAHREVSAQLVPLVHRGLAPLVRRVWQGPSDPLG